MVQYSGTSCRLFGRYGNGFFDLDCSFVVRLLLLLRCLLLSICQGCLKCKSESRANLKSRAKHVRYALCVWASEAVCPDVGKKVGLRLAKDPVDGSLTVNVFPQAGGYHIDLLTLLL